MIDYDVLNRTRLASRNPAAFVQVGLDYIESRLKGKSVPDPISPMVQTLEISSAQAIVHIEEAMAIDRRNYPILATRMRDLYANASDYDMINRFTQPSRVKMHLMFPREELIARMVTVPGSQLRKAVIPRNTMIKIDNQTSLITLYPIEIRQPIHRGVSNTKAPLFVIYNTDKRSPLMSLDDNVVNWTTVPAPGGRVYIDIEMAMLQLNRSVTKDSLEGSNFVFNLPFNDNFHAIRIFYGSDRGGWKEMRTTYSEWVYSPTSPTGIIKVEEETVEVRIPPVYTESGRIPEGAGIRFDVYTTKGKMYNDLSTLQGNAFKVAYTEDLDDPDMESYAAPVRSLEFAVYSNDILTGGADGLTFDQMNNAIINNTSIIDVPITPAQIEARLDTLGFDVIKHRDDLTDRVYLASKTLAPASGSNFNSAPSSGIMTLQTRIDDLVKYPGVWDNNHRVTISPDTLFQLNEGILSLVDPSRYPDAISNTTETLVNTVNAGDYVYSPFHYVLDTNNDNFNFRAYHLQDPRQTTREFLHENGSTQLEVQTVGFDIRRTETGYLLTVTALVGSNWRALDPTQRHAQLGFIPFGEQNFAYLNGTWKGRIEQKKAFYDTFEFPIECTFDLDADNNLIVDNFAIFTSTPRSLPMPLETNFTLTYSVSNYIVDGLEYSEVDSWLGKELLPTDVYGISVERVNIELGSALKMLWANSRSLGGAPEYKRYDTDVYAIWENDVYEIDPISRNRTFTIEDGEVKFKRLHAAGDPVLVDGKPKILHEKNSLILDPKTGQPIPVSERPILRVMDMFMIDGVYFYANDDNSLSDLNHLTDSIVRDYIPRLETLTKRKLEKTDIFFYPKKTIGNIPVLVDDAVEINVNAQLSYQITLYATETGYRDMEFREMIESVCDSAISTTLTNKTVSRSSIISRIVQNADERLAGFDVKMMAGKREVTTFTVKDDSYRASIRRLAALNDDGRIIVKEDITYKWDLHLPSE